MEQRKITGFFKKFTVPKDHVPVQHDSDEEIVVASPRPQSRQDAVAQAVAARRQPTASPTKQRSPQKRRPLSRESSLSSAKSIATPRKSPKKRSLPSSLDGAGDDEESLYYSSPRGSVQRSLKAVEVPSPARRASPSPTPIALPPPPPPAPRAEQPASRSFSSFSTLSSMPVSSQSSSRRVMKGGLQAVTNSDSGSAEDSDEDLADLDSFIPRKKPKLTPPAEAPVPVPPTQKAAKPFRKSARLSDESSKSRKVSPRLPPSPPRTVYKHSLANMVKEQQKQDKHTEKIAETYAKMAEADKKREEWLKMADMMGGEDIAAAMADDSDDAQRMMQAMVRTEALQDHQTFHFFQDLPPKAQDEPFPTIYLADKPYANVLMDRRKREQACLSGFIRDLAEQGCVDFTMVSWFTSQLVIEPREDLCEAYLEIMKASLQHEETGPACSSLRLRDLYHTEAYGYVGPGGIAEQQSIPSVRPAQPTSKHTGDEVRCICGYSEEDGSTVACDTCGFWQHTTCFYPQYDGQALPDDLPHDCASCKPRELDVPAARRRQRERRVQRKPDRKQLPKYTERVPGLRYTVATIAYASTGKTPDLISRAVCDLALASIDDDVREDVDVQCAIQDSIELLLDGRTTEQLDEVYGLLRDCLLRHPKALLSKALQCRLITTLPASTVSSHYMRRRLALSCITEYDASKPPPLTSPKWCKIILKSLKKAPEFHVSEKTDYALLCALTEVMDIAIDAGFSDFAFLAAKTESAKPTSLFSKSAPISEEEQTFNAQVDVLASHLRLMASRIKDAGATHLRRTEAKSVLDRVIVRLEHGVRTRPKPKKGIFSGGGEEVAQRGFMEGFAKGGAKREDVQVVDESSIKAAGGQLDGAMEESGDVGDMSVTADTNRDMSGQREDDAVGGGVAEDEEAVSGTATDDADEGLSMHVEEPVTVANTRVPGKRRISAWDKLDGEVRL